MGMSKRTDKQIAIDEKIGLAIKELRPKELTQEKMAEKLDISTEGYKKNENGKASIPLYRLLQICDILGCDIDCLLGRIDFTKHKYKFIHDETGLSEEACKKLTGELYLSDYDTPESHQIMKNDFIQAQGDILSWFIEHDLLEYVKNISFNINDIQRFSKDMKYIPEELYKPLENAFSTAYRARLDITERQFEYMDRIALYLINCPQNYVRSIKDLKPFILKKNGQTYRWFDKYKFTDFDDYVEYEADKKDLTADEREIIAMTSESLSEITFPYFQYLYDLELYKQRTVNAISKLIDKYQEHVSGESEDK